MSATGERGGALAPCGGLGQPHSHSLGPSMSSRALECYASPHSPLHLDSSSPLSEEQGGT
jgi:hypothetical protein